jgi:hypothetical protein
MRTLTFSSSEGDCCNPNFGLTNKVKGLQGCGPRGSSKVKVKRSQGCEPKRSPGITSHTPGSVRKCEGIWGSMSEWTLTLPRQLPLWEMESQWTPKISKSNFRGQNSMTCGVIYIIGKLLEHRCLKWAKKKGRKSNYQFDSQREKIKNWSDLLGYRGHATYHWKALNENYNFAWDCILIRSLLARLWGSKVAGVPTSAILGFPFGSLGREKPFGCRLRG